VEKMSIKKAEIVEKCIQVFTDGGVVMHPTETCYGFATDVFNKKALEKLYRLKGRDFNKPVSIMVSDLDMALKYGEFSPKALEFAEKYWPGPLSIVVKRTKALPEFLNKGEDFVSIRCSNHGFCEKLVKTFGSPITTTSANISGMEPLYSPDYEIFDEDIDLVVDAGKIEQNAPSTVVKIEGDKVEVLRQGEVLCEEV
jgi:L-threonylcarbamoyladenylate synthase